MWLLQVTATKRRKKFGPQLSTSRCFASKMLTQMEIVCTAEIQSLQLQAFRDQQHRASVQQMQCWCGSWSHQQRNSGDWNRKWRFPLVVSTVWVSSGESCLFLTCNTFCSHHHIWLSSINRRGMKVSKTQVSYCWPSSLPSQEPEEDPLPGSVLSAEGGDRNAVNTSTITCLYNLLKLWCIRKITTVSQI